MRAFRAYGTRRPTGQISMRRASAGVMEAGSWSTGVTVELLRLGRHWPPLRAQLAHVAPGRGGLACPTKAGGGPDGARRGGVTTDHLFFRLTLAKLRYSSTRRRRAPGSTYGFNGWLGVPNNRPASTSDVPPTDLASGFHPMRHSATTCRKTPRVITGTPSSSRRSNRRRLQQRPVCIFSRKLYRVPPRACVSTGLPPSSWSSQIAFKWPLRP